ncbi:hypothetical protein ACSQUR_003219 [Vibrio alginolyticus]
MFLFENLKDDHFNEYTWGWIYQLYDISANQYLDFAILDLKDGQSERNLINAISNAKKALHIRMEEIAKGFGYQSKSNKFPSMFGYLESCGFVTPRTLERINSLRNRVEHDYISPKLEDVETYIDVVSLFLESTRKWMERRVEHLTFVSGVLDESGNFELFKANFQWDKGLIELVFRKLDTQVRETEMEMEKVVIDCEDRNYFPFIKMTLKNDT